MSGINCVTVLAPNGRRQKVQVTPNTTVLQVIEEVCKKQELRPEEYDLKHHNHVLDTTLSLRYVGLPNNAQLEMAKLEIRRMESEVTVSLVPETGSRLTGTFQPSDSLWNVVMTLIPDLNIEERKTPVIFYIHRDISGIQKLQETTLRILGVTSGRVLLRLIFRDEDVAPHQASVAASLPHRPVAAAIQARYKPQIVSAVDHVAPGTSAVHQQEEKDLPKGGIESQPEAMETVAELEEQAVSSALKRSEPSALVPLPVKAAMDSLPPVPVDQPSETAMETEVMLGDRSALAFNLSTAEAVRYEDLPEDFFDLTISDMKILFRELKEKRNQLDTAPLQTSTMRELENSKKVLSHLNKYKKTVIRVQFPDRTVLQGIFTPLETIGTVADFVREYLENPSTAFHLFTTPPKLILEPSTTLVTAHCVPNALLHFGPQEPYNGETRYLKPEVFANFTSHRAASAVATQARVHRQKPQDAEPEKSMISSHGKTDPSPTTSCNKNRDTNSNKGKAPKWFKTSKK